MKMKTMEKVTRMKPKKMAVMMPHSVDKPQVLQQKLLSVVSFSSSVETSVETS